jgi:hypothetical protein
MAAASTPVVVPALAEQTLRKPDQASPRKIAVSLPAILALVGAAVGFMTVRGFMLDAIEEIGWRLFWEAFFKGDLRSSDWGMVFKSATFLKLAIGTLIGGAAGLVVGSRLEHRR